MATNNPRITITLDQRDYDVLHEVAKSQGQSMSSILADLWKLTVPTMERLLDLLKEAANVKDSARTGIQEAIQEAESRMVPILGESLRNLDLFEEQIRESVRSKDKATASPPSRGTRDAGGAERSSRPPASNTGVRFSKSGGLAKKSGVKRS